MRPRSRPAFDNGQMPVGCQGSPIPWTDSITGRNRTTRPKDSKLLTEIELSQDQKGPPALHRFRELLQELHPSPFRKDSPVSRAHQDREANEDHKRDHELLHRHQQIIGQCLRLVAQTTHAQQTICADDRRQLQKRGLRPRDRRKPRRKNQLGPKNLCTSGIRVKNVLPVTNQNVDLRKRISGRLLRFHGVLPHSLEINQTGCRPH